jgi:hypothetical protein
MIPDTENMLPAVRREYRFEGCAIGNKALDIILKGFNT